MAPKSYDKECSQSGEGLTPLLLLDVFLRKGGGGEGLECGGVYMKNNTKTADRTLNAGAGLVAGGWGEARYAWTTIPILYSMENGLANFHRIIGDRVHSTIMIYAQGKDC